jgi:four helix bundle protein
MLKILDLGLSMMPAVRRVTDRLKKVNPNDADQLDRACTSVIRLTGEGASARGRNGSAKLQQAHAEAQEGKLTVRIAVAKGYLDEGDADVVELLDKLDHMGAVLFKLVHRPR